MITKNTITLLLVVVSCKLVTFLGYDTGKVLLPFLEAHLEITFWKGVQEA